MAERWVLPRIGTIEDPLRLCVLISGSGSGMVALLNHQNSNPSNHVTKLVISENENAKGLLKAQEMGTKTLAVPLPLEEDKQLRRQKHEKTIQEILVENEIELVILSGYMRILTPDFVKPWAGRILNIHPSLLPNFPGAHAHRDVIAAGAKESGCTVHFVDSGMDTGPIIAQERVEVLDDDNEETLAERVKQKEHLLYPRVIDQLASGEIQSP